MCPKHLLAGRDWKVRLHNHSSFCILGAFANFTQQHRTRSKVARLNIDIGFGVQKTAKTPMILTALYGGEGELEIWGKSFRDVVRVTGL